MASCFECAQQFQPDGTSGDLCPDCALKARSELGLPFQLRQLWSRWRTQPTRFPVVTLFLIGIMIAVYSLTSRGPAERDTIESMLAMDTWKVLHGEVWRLVTASFLHFRLEHLIGNLVCLCVVGPLAEALFGHLKLLLLWLATGTMGSVVQLLPHHHHPIIGYGASASASGLLGVLLIVYLIGQVPLSKKSRLVRVFLIVALTTVDFGGEWFLMRRPNSAHIGGLIAGLLLALVVPLRSAKAAESPT